MVTGSQRYHWESKRDRRLRARRERRHMEADCHYPGHDRRHYNFQIHHALFITIYIVVRELLNTLSFILALVTPNPIVIDQKDNIILRCILIACKLFGLVVLLVGTIMIDNVLTYVRDCYHFSIKPRLSTLLVHLVANFPSVITGIAFVFTIAFLVREIHRRSEVYNRCMQDQQLKLESIKLKLQEEKDQQLKLENINSKLQEEIAKFNKESEKLRLSLEEESDKRLYGICQDQNKTIVLLPCQHLCLCKQCLDHKKWRNCPIYRQGVESTIEVYV